MYAKPPLVVNISSTSNAAVGTSQTANILAAPGADKAIRVVAAAVGFNSNVAAGAIMRGTFTDTGSNPVCLGCVARDAGQEYVLLPEPGVQLDVNVGLDYTNTCSVASAQYRLTVHYYVDDVS